MSTKSNPGVYNCYAKAEPDEPMFTLLGRDPVASFLVGIWIDARKKLGLDTPEKLAEASACSDALHDWAIERLGPERMLEVVTAMHQLLVEYAKDTDTLGAAELLEDAKKEQAARVAVVQNLTAKEPATT
jgi:hypothetical protein